MKTVIVIPSRYDSSRFPGKPLAEIAGYSMLYRIWKIAITVGNVKDVIIATDDDRIYMHAESFGAKAVMTSPECRNGTERVWEAVNQLKYKPDTIINFQGDAVLSPPWIIQALVDSLNNDREVQLVTPAIKLDWDGYERLAQAKDEGQTSGTTVTFDNNHNALYFSKTIIPFMRNRNVASPPVYIHIGMYGYRYEMLKHYLSLPPTPLETVEQLEQLRALEYGLPIRVVEVDYRGRSHWSVDNPEDIAKVEKIIASDGELVNLQ
ncbi:MAG: 3-deoxy-manno-octulosonate cytidylyltransferase [Candidatus Zixiibacteriota bacterium]